jgi:hypothetical protein
MSNYAVVVDDSEVNTYLYLCTNDSIQFRSQEADKTKTDFILELYCGITSSLLIFFIFVE